MIYRYNYLLDCVQYVAQYPDGTSIWTHADFETPFSVLGKRSISNES